MKLEDNIQNIHELTAKNVDTIKY